MNDNKTYSLTSSLFRGEVILEFNARGLLTKYDATGADLNGEQIEWINHALPKHIDEIKQILGTSSSAKLTEVSDEITFEMFWNRYDEKIRSSRKRTQARWNKMSKSESVRAYRYITRYEMNLTPGTTKKYAETYLNAELWNN